MTATEILMRNRLAFTQLQRATDKVMEPVINRMFDLMVRHGHVTTCIAPLTWQEKVLMWNPCNDHVASCGAFTLKIVTT